MLKLFTFLFWFFFSICIHAGSITSSHGNKIFLYVFGANFKTIAKKLHLNSLNNLSHIFYVCYTLMQNIVCWRVNYNGAGPFCYRKGKCAENLDFNLRVGTQTEWLRCGCVVTVSYLCYSSACPATRILW